MSNSTQHTKIYTFTALLYALLGAVLFSAKAILVKLVYQQGVDITSLVVLRMWFALPFFAFMMFRNAYKSHYLLTAKDYLLIVFMGVIGYYASIYFDFWGLKYISAGLERLVLFVYPTLILIARAIIYKKPISLLQWAALSITYVGLLIAFGANVVSSSHTNVWLGTSLVFISALCYALFLLATDVVIVKTGTIYLNSIVFFISGICGLIHCLIVGISVDHLFVIIQKSGWMILLMAFFTTFLPALLVSESIRMLDSGKTSIASTVGPVSVIILGYFLLDEKITNFQIIGTVIVLTGILVLSIWTGNERSR